MEIKIWYTAKLARLLIIASFIIGDKKSVAKAQKELNNFVKKYPNAFDNYTNTGITLVQESNNDTCRYFRINELGRLTITAHVRNYIHDFNKEIREVENGI
jgi:hypothetical protein